MDYVEPDQLRVLADELERLRDWAQYAILRCDGCGKEYAEDEIDEFWHNEDEGLCGCTEACIDKAIERERSSAVAALPDIP